MNTGLFLSSLFLIISIITWIAFLALGIRMIALGKRRKLKGLRVKGWIMIIIGFIFSSAAFWPSFAYFYIERVWFEEMGKGAVFWKLVGAPWRLFFRFALISAGFLALNLIIARKLCPIPGGVHRWTEGAIRTVNRIMTAIIVIVSIIMGSSAMPLWDEYIRYEGRGPYGIGKEGPVQDPQFGKDISYYLFTMPIRNFTSLWTKALFWITLLSMALLYNFYRDRDSRTKMHVIRRGIPHMSALWILVLVMSIWRSIVRVHRLVYSKDSVAFGAGYTDIHIRIPAYYIYIVIVALVGLAVILNVKWKKRFLATVPVALWFSSYIILIWIVPNIYQAIKVSPNESIWEREYISRNIKYTRIAYGLDRIKVSEITPEVATLEKIKAHPGVLRNVQLWDRRAVRETFNQTQVFLPFYTFWDVDADRYHLVNASTGTSEYRQVMISAREMDISRLPSRTWVTQRLIYTHGYGVCMGPVNEFTPGGVPNLWIEGVPPKIHRPELKITRPEIYYGEVTKDYVFVKTLQMEFNYPETKGSGEQEDRYTVYEGNGGIPVGSFFRKCMLAIRFTDFRVAVSEYLQPDSRAMFNRQILDRAKRIAPFLLYDNDPYIVIGNSGKLWWIIDAYVTSKHFPYSEPYYKKFNYIRNPIKVVIDAYNGTTDLYVWDEDEPITKAYMKMFPGLFKTKREIPDGLEKHNRYPDDLTKIQAEMYCIYHMQDPQVFYSKGDRWDMPYEVYYQTKEQPMVPLVPLYVMIYIPGSNKEEFVSIFSFTPYPTDKRPNMVAWMAVRNDEPHTGEILVYVFPKGQAAVSGPAQIEARINTNPEMSEKLTLWDEGGSTVIRGNLLTLPVDNALFYVEPLYLQSEVAKRPLLTQVIVAAGDRVAWAENFDMAMEKVFAVGERVETASASSASSTSQDPLIAKLNSAKEKLAKYESQIQSGDTANAVKTLEELKKEIDELSKL